MNKHFFKTLAKAFALSCMSFAMVSCSDTDELVGEQGGGDAGNIPVVFSSAVVGGQPWTEGDKLSVLIDGSIREFTASAKGLLTPTEPLFWNGTEPRDVEAWFPAADPRPSSVEISRDQSANLQPDFLYAKARVTPSERKKLEFNHQLTKIEVVFNTTKEVGAVTIGYEAFNLKASWDGGVWSNLSTPGEVQPKDMGNKTFAALVLPQSVAANTKFVHATVGTQRMYFSLKADQKLEAGNTYTFTLTPTDEGTTPDPQPQQPTLNADKAEIVADGTDKVTFEVTPATAKVVGVGHLFEGANGATFATTTPATYKFKAVNEGLETAEVSVVAVAAPVLSVAPQAIKVGETATLKVMFKDTDRTADASFTKNGAVFSGAVFTADAQGEFTFEATVDGHKTNPVTVSVSPADKPEPVIPTISTSDATTITANGVDAVHFSVTPEGATLLKEGEPFEGLVFTSNVAGTFRFKAVYEGNQSVEEVVVTVNEVVVPEPTPAEPEVKVIPLVLTVDNWEINRKNQLATFTLKYNNEDVTAKAHLYSEKYGELAEGNKIGWLTISQPNGLYTVIGQYNGMTSNAITINVVESGAVKGNQPAQLDAPQLAVSKTSITADGKDMITFSVSKAGATIVKETKGGSFNGGSFTTTQSGDFKFHAEYNGQKSATITVKATSGAYVPEGKVVLTADKYEIYNNGQTAVLKVMKGDVDVTAKASFTTNGGEITNGKFSSTVPGIYTIKATAYGVVSNEMNIEVLKDPHSQIVPTLKANKKTIVADGADTVTFTVNPAEAEIFCITTGEKLTGKTFKTSIANTYQFKAVLKGVDSVEIITIEAIEPSNPDVPMDGDVKVTPEGDGWINQDYNDNIIH